MKSTIAAIAFFTALASAQIDPSTVPIATRNQWCISQRAACPSLCAQQSSTGSGAVASNTCDRTTLAYSCVCASGLSINATEFSQTIPYFICTETNTQCVTACNGNSACQSACREDNPCGASDPTRVNSTSAAASATSGGEGGSSGAAETTGFDTFGGAGGGSGSDAAAETGSSGSSNSGAAQMLAFGSSFSLVAVVGGIAAGFGLML